MHRPPPAPTTTDRRPFLPAAEGLRAVAATGILITHVAFQTGVPAHSWQGRILTRFDFFVPVFFALSALLLWRRYGNPTPPTAGQWRRYTRSRIIRLYPVYLLLIGIVVLFHQPAFRVDPRTILATGVFAQLYVPHGLAPGLTHLWSLAVEVAFYVVLPLAAILLRRCSHPVRIRILVVLAALSLSWGLLTPFDAVAHRWQLNWQLFPPAYTPWFIVGMLAAEYETAPPRWLVVLCRRPIWPLLVGVAALVCAATPVVAPPGLAHPTGAQFAAKIFLGTVFAAAWVWPVVFTPATSWFYRWLSSGLLLWLGSISYGIFLYHLPLLEHLMALSAISPFHGNTLLIGAVTWMASVIVAYASYEWVEDPLRRLSGTVSTSKHAQAMSPTAVTKGASPA
ncbi:acyltransferase family protein [Corynebacterium choanae]|uniref:O-acetyltransferase OatA n=1 Tax=Corynebacterium choanae TaxID=1862358 RepID=A0A3G6J3G0_9CORY|nr:acyltransferase [Corynebacterium choanae]AZA12605.1 O-acetyltransferase OatA [Corynebacterium choanae]